MKSRDRWGASEEEEEMREKEKEGLALGLEGVERETLAIAQTLSSHFHNLRLQLHKGTSSSVDHMQCFSDAAGRLQECTLDAATKGNRYINSCLRLNEEMKGVDNLAKQLYIGYVCLLVLFLCYIALCAS